MREIYSELSRDSGHKVEDKDTAVLGEYGRNTSTRPRRGSTVERNKRVSNTSDSLNRIGWGYTRK